MLKHGDVDFGSAAAHHSGDFLGLPVDDASQNECEAAAGIHLLMEFARVDAAPAAIVDIPRKCMQLLNF